MTARIVVIAKQEEQVGTLCVSLREAGYEPMFAVASADIALALSAQEFDMVIYDSVTSYGPCESVLARIRRAVDAPLLVLAPSRDETFIVRALALGADGCLPKPYGMPELLARVEAHLRRYRQWKNAPHAETAEVLLIDGPSQSVVVGSKEVKLTPTEYRVLAYLVDRRGAVVTRQELCDLVWGSSESTDVDMIGPHVYYLRRKIESDPHRPKHILTKWGIGYYLAGKAQKT